MEAKKVVFDPRNKKTMNFLIEYDMTVDDAFEIIKKLRPENYYEGPDDDYNGTPGNVMKFLYNYNDIIIYIKLKIWTDKNGNSGAVMSFHKEGTYE